jgi:predicted transcriptional regulator
MGSARFSLRLEPELKAWVEAEAQRRDRSAAYVVTQAVTAMRDASERKHRMVEEAIAEADKGVFISEEAMTRWFVSLGIEHNGRSER